MTKRPCPFVDDFVPQSKMFIGIKQSNTTGDRMQKVYENTLAKLFKRAKKPIVEPEGNNNVTVPVDYPEEVHMQESKSKLKQLCLGRDGKLMAINNNVEQHEPSILQSCQLCLAMPQTSCNYCEARLCSGCVLACHHCQGYFCTGCSVVGYDFSDTSCISCYK